MEDAEGRYSDPTCDLERTAVSVIRVGTLAKELGLDVKTILIRLHSLGFPARSASTMIPNEAKRALVQTDWDVTNPGPSGDPGMKPAPIRDGERSSSLKALRRELPMFDDLQQALSGSPYSLPHEHRQYIDGTLMPLIAELETRSARARQQINETAVRTLSRNNRTYEIFESNKIEGLGTNLSETYRLLNENSMIERTNFEVARDALHRCLGAEPKVKDVIGLGAAKILAETFCADAERALSEADIRQLHGLIMVDDIQGGGYKKYINAISGSSHVPPSPVDTPDAMRALTEWLRDSEAPPLWQAAVAHAWFTHIHPFHDGNGRVARLLANLILIRSGYPPLIVRSSGDRGGYLEALSASDSGGDILPLTRVFRRVTNRAVNDLEDPGFALSLFREEVERRSEPKYVRWNTLFEDFLTKLAEHLLLNGIRLDRVGGVARSDFDRMTRPNYQENVWVAKLKVQAKSQDLLLHVAVPTARSTRTLERDEVGPSIFMSVRNPRSLDAKPYIPVGDQAERFTHEFTPIVDTGRILIRQRSMSQRAPTNEAASLASERIARIANQLILS